MISDTIYKRSVLKNIKLNKNIITKPANAAGDAVVISGGTAVSVKTGINAVIASCNALACAGAKTTAVNAAIVLPRGFDEKYLQQLINRLGDQCGLSDAVLGDVTVTVTGAVKEVIVTATAVGVCGKYSVQKLCLDRNPEYSDMDIVAVGCIGLDGTRTVLEKYGDEAAKLYTDAFIAKATASDEELSVVKSAGIALEAGADYLHAAGDGGIFAALWRLSEEMHAGIEVDFRKIPVRQEIIEICEIFNINVYELSSLGCLLMTLHRGYDIVNLFKSKGINARIIGHTTDSNAKILRTEDEVRYLEVPRTEESERIIFDGLDGKR